jgi:acetyl-CoA carboxylase biotin carboxyl carrier protein
MDTVEKKNRPFKGRKGEGDGAGDGERSGRKGTNFALKPFSPSKKSVFAPPRPTPFSGQKKTFASSSRRESFASRGGFDKKQRSIENEGVSRFEAASFDSQRKNIDSYQQKEAALPKREKRDGEGTTSFPTFALEKLASLLTAHDLTEIEFEENGRRIYMSRKRGHSLQERPSPQAATEEKPIPSQPPKIPSPVPKSEAEWKNHPGLILSPMVGTVFVTSEPGAPPFVKVGDAVEVGQTLLIIEAMKVLNPIKAPRAGIVAAIFISNQDPVEFSDPLLVIEEHAS